MPLSNPFTLAGIGLYRTGSNVTSDPASVFVALPSLLSAMMRIPPTMCTFCSSLFAIAKDPSLDVVVVANGFFSPSTVIDTFAPAIPSQATLTTRPVRSVCNAGDELSSTGPVAMRTALGDGLGAHSSTADTTVFTPPSRTIRSVNCPPRMASPGMRNN
jgi:hypothetical protein